MKTVPGLLHYSYRVESRDVSLEYLGFYPALQKIASEIHVFWYDKYLTDRDKLQKELIAFVDKTSLDVVFFVLMNNEFSFDTPDYLRSKYICYHDSPT